MTLYSRKSTYFFEQMSDLVRHVRHDFAFARHANPIEKNRNTTNWMLADNTCKYKF